MLTVVAFIFALAVLIVFHEFGHYLAARACGVKVLRFSVGFGAPLLKKTFRPGGTEWVIAAIPFGGYVKMLGEQDDEVAPADLPHAFHRQHVLKRIAIVAAGPFANFLLAILIYWLLFAHGMPGQRPILDAPAKQTAAAQAGFAKWDVVETVNGEPVQTWEDVNWLLAKQIVKAHSVEIGVRGERGQRVTRVLHLGEVDGDTLDKDFLAVLGMTPAKQVQPRVGKILPGSSAEAAGMRTGDLVTAVDGKPVTDWRDFSDAIRLKPGRPVVVDVVRDDAPMQLRITPAPIAEEGKTVGRIGVAPYLLVDVEYSGWDALRHAIQKCWDMSLFSLEMFGRMLFGQVSWSNLSGPLTIAQYAGETAQLGWLPYLLFLALVSVSLGVVNLLPVPILDGGHLMYYMAEIIKGSPVSDRAMELGQKAGVAVLVLLMSVALYNDIARQLVH